MEGRKSKVKVVRVITRLNIGGPSIHAILLSGSLDPARFDTTLVVGRASPSEGSMLDLARGRGLKIEYIPEMKRSIGLHDLMAFIKLLILLRKIRPDVVHTHTAKAGTIGRLAAKFSGVPVRIHTFHGHVLQGYFSSAAEKLFTFTERALARSTSRLIAISNKVRSELVDKLKIAPEEKCVVIKLGFDLRKFLDDNSAKGRFRSDLGVSGDTVLIGLVGRLVPIKNHKMFIDAARILLQKDKGLKVKFVIVGGGELKGKLEELVTKSGLKEYFAFTDWIKDLSGVYKDLDIVTLTSLNEGTPVSLIEAMASCRPVVATDVGGVSDIVINNENGFLVKSDDAEGFSDRLLCLIKDASKRAAFGNRGRELVREVYSRERLVKDTEKLYEECLGIDK